MSTSISTEMKTWVAITKESDDDPKEKKIYLTSKEAAVIRGQMAIKSQVFINGESFISRFIKLKEISDDDRKKIYSEGTKIYYRDRYCGMHEWNGRMICVWNMEVVRASDDKILDSYYFYYEQYEVKCIRNGENITEMRNNGNKITMRGFKPKC